MAFFEDFLEFLKEYEVAGLAVAFVMGLAVKDLVSSTVDNLIMPVVDALLLGGDWETTNWIILNVEFGVGQFFSALLDFVIIALLVYWFVRYILRKEEVGKI